MTIVHKRSLETHLVLGILQLTSNIDSCHCLYTWY